jgi:nucleoside-diphosphate-sugar epimerase
LITGSSGFIGTYVEQYFKNIFDCKGISRVNDIDISDYNSLNTLNFNPQIIIHCAGSLSLNIEDNFMSNVLGTLNICKLAKQKSVKHLILLSSIFIYENIENEYFNNYSISKKQSEDIAISYCRDYNINLTILRLSQIYDINRYAITNQKMLYDFIDTIKINKSLQIYGNKNPIRNYVYIDDVISIIDDVISNQNYGIFNVVNQKSHTISEIAYMIFEAYKMIPSIAYLKDKQDIHSIYVPTQNIYTLDKEYFSLQDGIKGIINNV